MVESLVKWGVAFLLLAVGLAVVSAFVMGVGYFLFANGYTRALGLLMWLGGAAAGFGFLLFLSGGMAPSGESTQAERVSIALMVLGVPASVGPLGVIVHGWLF